jgi:hypothetical protein
MLKWFVLSLLPFGFLLLRGLSPLGTDGPAVLYSNAIGSWSRRI